MPDSRTTIRRRRLLVVAGAVLGLWASAGAWAHDDQNTTAAPPEPSMAGPMADSGMMQRHMQMMPGMERLMMPRMDAARGRLLFASKGCVACHSVNGVGGHDATPLDAHTMGPAMHPFEFAAKMWRMAPSMIYAQEEALGYQIYFTGDELADIVAFVHHDEEQHKFSEADIPPEIRKLMNHSHGERPGSGARDHHEGPGHHHGAGAPPHHHGNRMP